MLTPQFLEPAGGLCGFFKVEATGIENLRQRYFTHDHRDDFRLGVEAFKDRHQLFAPHGLQGHAQHLGQRLH